MVLLALFVLAESRAAEPILPLALFKNRTFSVTSGIGFIIGLALFGAVTYLPLYMQIVKGRSATASGLLLTPMMAGVLIASIGSGNVISKTGRYKPFPIIGTAVAALGMILLSRLAVSTPLWLAALYLLVLGLGLGLVMQVLVLAAQNAVPYKMLGVATSGSTLFRQIGGAVGVSIFGAIFANRLTTELAERIPAGVHVPAAANPTLVHQLPEAVTAAVHRSVHGGDHTDLPRRGRLRDRRLPPDLAAARGAAPRDRRDRRDRRELCRPARGPVGPRARTDHQLDRERAHADGDLPTDRRRVSRGAHTCRGMAARPPRHQRHPGARVRRKATTPEEVAALTAELLHRGYLTIEPASGRLELSEQGRQANAALVEAGRAVLTRIAADIDPPEEEVADILRRLAISLLADIPRDAAREPRATSVPATAPSG